MLKKPSGSQIFSFFNKAISAPENASIATEAAVFWCISEKAGSAPKCLTMQVCNKKLNFSPN